MFVKLRSNGFTVGKEISQGNSRVLVMVSPDSTKNIETHESVVNSNEIEVRAAAKISKKS